MKVKLNNNEIDFLKDILKDTEFYNLTSEFIENQEIEIDDDITDEVRDLCSDEEVYEVYEAEKQNVRITKRGRVACDLVDKLYQ
ncbi:hypothetical protein [Clostridium sp.]|uniref:hypothetical protein n=1 Tax=Clostridium sp. TaxID=1506 RepID=UPI00260CAFFE|nr:hypothetical protein [Clostridium sp.]